ncbi:MAG: YeeE/YedE family protein [Proteobacteria bacterium]|nr:YeeE/YedE family protein [Pseudomonadota bacterium]
MKVPVAQPSTSFMGIHIALLIGFLFGVVLERAGFGNPRRVTDVFYLRDMAVLKVMFTAVVVAMLGLLYLAWFGWLDLGQVHVPATFLWAQIIGGLGMGVGFVVGGYCPTTSLVATVSGRIDGLVFIAGLLIGSIIWAEGYGLWKGLRLIGDYGQIKLDSVLGLPLGIVALLVVVLALVAFVVAGRLERRFGPKDAA